MVDDQERTGFDLCLPWAVALPGNLPGGGKRAVVLSHEGRLAAAGRGIFSYDTLTPALLDVVDIVMAEVLAAGQVTAITAEYEAHLKSAVAMPAWSLAHG